SHARPRCRARGERCGSRSHTRGGTAGWAAPRSTEARWRGPPERADAADHHLDRWSGVDPPTCTLAPVTPCSSRQGLSPRSSLIPRLAAALLELRPLLEEVQLRRLSPDPLPLDERVGEQSHGTAAILSNEGAQALLCHDRILVLPQDVLQFLGPCHESLGGLADNWLRQLRSVAGSLHPDPHGVQVVTLGLLGQGLDRLAKLLELTRCDPWQREVSRHHLGVLNSPLQSSQK